MEYYYSNSFSNCYLVLTYHLLNPHLPFLFPCWRIISFGFFLLWDNYWAFISLFVCFFIFSISCFILCSLYPFAEQVFQGHCQLLHFSWALLQSLLGQLSITKRNSLWRGKNWYVYKYLCSSSKLCTYTLFLLHRDY